MTVNADSGLAPAGMWPEIDPCLCDGTRAPAAPFPLDVLPGRWRGWVEDCSRAGIPTDYVAQCSLAVVAALTGGRMHAEVTFEWYESLVLWQVLVGEASSGKSPALSRARWLLRSLEPDEDNAEGPTPAVLADATTFLAGAAFNRNSRGVVVWREDIADWFAAANAASERNGWLAGWNTGQLGVDVGSKDRNVQIQGFSVGILGTTRMDRLAALAGDDGDTALATRLLYAWPEPSMATVLQAPPPDFEGMIEMLRRITALEGTNRRLGFLMFMPPAVERLQALLPALRRLTREADGIEAAWIGKGPGNIVRVACHLALMEWAGSDLKEAPQIAPRHVEASYRLWSTYFLPHARSVFAQSEISSSDRLAREATRWLKRSRYPRVSREEIRCRVFGRRVNAAGTDDIIARLEEGHVLRALDPPSKLGRPPRRWEVNPALR
ncbi:MAG: DUF3987 domain-containing protein [Enhydrobacter sp.]|nr:MAG: DUF3987 domain-containing protein [Enhydrobacter sp.]